MAGFPLHLSSSVVRTGSSAPRPGGGRGAQEARRLAGLLVAHRALHAGLEWAHALGHALALRLVAVLARLPAVEASVRLMLSGPLAGVPVVAGQSGAPTAGWALGWLALAPLSPA